MFRRLVPAVVAASLIVACGGEENSNNSSNNASNNGTTTANNGGTTSNTNGSTTNTNGATNGTNGSTTNTTGTNNVCMTADCECFSNDDCPSNMRCEDTGAGIETPRCVEGARGTGVTGDACEAEADCASGVCIGRNDTPNVCSEECDMNDPVCPNDLECVWVPGSGGDEYWCVTSRE